MLQAPSDAQVAEPRPGRRKLLRAQDVRARDPGNGRARSAPTAALAGRVGRRSKDCERLLEHLLPAAIRAWARRAVEAGPSGSDGRVGAAPPGADGLRRTNRAARSSGRADPRSDRVDERGALRTRPARARRLAGRDRRRAEGERAGALTHRPHKRVFVAARNLQEGGPRAPLRSTGSSQVRLSESGRAGGVRPHDRRSRVAPGLASCIRLLRTGLSRRRSRRSRLESACKIRSIVRRSLTRTE
jgi:hypothetical protein